MNLITNIRIKNFFSIKDEINVNFKASNYNIENNKDRLFKFNDSYYNKIISFYGANASGKTSLLKSLVFLSSVINNEQTDQFPPSFKNKFAHLNSKSEIDINLILDINNVSIEFLYKVKFKAEKHKNIGIDNEELYLIEDEKRTTLFNRKNKKIKNVDENIIESVFNDLSYKKSLFVEFEKFEKFEILKQIKSFFKSIQGEVNINVFNTKLGTDFNDEFTIGTILHGFDDINESDNKLQKDLNSFLLSFFNSIGLDIKKIEAQFSEENEKEKNFLGIEIYHQVNQKEPLEFKLESDGTQMLMKILLDIFMIKISNSILIIDEFDSIIHPMLTPIIINLLIENNIQIIYSTHNIYNMKFLQKDEIFLISKNNKHETLIESAKDNKDIKGYENLLSLYENGYLGGVPKVENIITKII